MQIGAPLGLLGLLALPAIVWLHRYVVQARRVPVSHLGLWVDAQHAGAEGADPRRPPLTWVLLLELLAAVALTAALADVRLGGPLAAPPTLGIALDVSASMSGGSPGSRPVDAVRARLGGLPASTRVVVAAAWPAPRVLSDGDAAEALAALDALPFRAPSHDLGPARDLLGALGIERVATLTDDPAIDGVHLGQPADNVGFVGAAWPPGGRPTVAVQAFGPADVPVTITAGPVSLQVVAPRGTFRVVELPVDGEAVEVALSPGGALAADDRAFLADPVLRPLGARVTLPEGPAARAFRAAVAAIPTLSADAPPVLWFGPGDGWTVAVVGGPPDHVATRLSADVFSPLMAGVSVADLEWPATAAAPPPGATVHLTSAEGPVVWQVGSAFTLNLADAETNLFRREAFVALVANLADELQRAHGALPNANVRAGEVVPVAAAPEWEDPRWALPDGGSVALNERPRDLAGVYRIVDGGAAVATLGVTFADPRESDLTTRVPAEEWRPEPTTAAEITREARPAWPWLAALGALIGAWALLGRRAET